DLDGDTDQDLAVANSNSGDVTILLNKGNGKFSEAHASPVTAGSEPSGIIAADLDGDTDQDLAVANRGSDNVTILRNKGNARFSERRTSPESAGDMPSSLAVEDLDNDGDQDLAVANEGSDNVTVLLN